MWLGYVSIPCALPVVVSTLLHHIRPPSGSNSSRKRSSGGNVIKSFLYQLIAPAFLLFAIPPHSVSSLLRPLAKLISQWPKLLRAQKEQQQIRRVSSSSSDYHSQSKKSQFLRFLIAGGPFGSGCGKICELMSAYLLLTVRYYDTTNNSRLQFPHDAFQWGPIPSFKSLCAVLFLSVVVNIILSAWSKIQKSRGDHNGVNNMVNNSVGRSLSFSEHLYLSCLAFGNALCEEGIYRGFFHYELMKSGQLSRDAANLMQAVSFGLGHYHGIPSGWTGVCLTFVYGWIMGKLMMYGDGLCLPVLAHTVADYFIFAVIARMGADAKSR